MQLSKTQFAILLSVFTITLFIFNWSIGLWDQDEAAYAGFGKRMLETGDYLIPEYPWSFIHRKPPLHFWMNAFWMEIFGVNEWSTRFSSALSVIGTILLIWKLGGKVFGDKIGGTAAIVAMVSLYSIFLTKIAVTDADLMFFQTLAVLSLLAFFKLKKKSYLIGLFIGVAGAALVKGPPVYVVIFGILGLCFWVKKYRISSIVAFFVAVLGFTPLYLWGSATWAKDGGEFVSWLVEWYILNRNKPFTVQTGPPGYFLIFFGLTFFSFVHLLIGGLGQIFKKVFKERAWNSDEFLLLAWIIPGWFLYEFIPSKLPTYAIACFAAVAILIAKKIHSLNELDKKERGFIVSFILGGILGLALLILPWVYLNVKAAIILNVFGVVVIAGSWVVFKERKQGGKPIFKPGLIMLLLALSVFAVAVPDIDDKRSAGKIVAKKIKVSNPKNLVVTHKIMIPSLIFYLEQENIPLIYDYEFPNWKPYWERGDHFLFFDVKDDIRKAFELTINDYKIDSLEGWQSDRGKVIKYYWYWK